MTGLFSLAGKTALVTGGARGLGRMIAESLIDAGATVMITARKPDACAAAAGEMGAIALPGDAGTPEGIGQIAAQLRSLGITALDILVNNAGRTWGAPIGDFPDHAWPGVMAVNVQAPFRMVQEMLPELAAAARPDDPARIVNIGSIGGVRPNDLGAYSYGASKAALHFLTKQLAHDLAARYITANAVLPGFFPTAMTRHLRDDPDRALEGQVPLGRLGRASDIGGTVIFLASRAGAYVTGTDIVIDGGLSMK
jgi:NAD(P)-dependent dehydrogenase (short-subunit alcohol dehydrogenase family)